MATAWVGRGWFIVRMDWWLRHAGIFRATPGTWWLVRNGSIGVGPDVVPSAHLGPCEEGWDVPYRHIPRQRLHTQIPVVSQQHHLPQQTDWLLCQYRKKGIVEDRAQGTGIALKENVVLEKARQASLQNPDSESRVRKDHAWLHGCASVSYTGLCFALGLRDAQDQFLKGL